MSDTAAVSVTSPAVAAVVPSRSIVTPWRAALVVKRDELVKMIQENAEPEYQFQTAADISCDITNAVKDALRKKYGCVFNRLVDGPS